MNSRNSEYAQRNLTIDIFRAVTMLLMIIVNDLWSVKGYPDWFRHADFHEDFLGLSDVVFPAFLFAVGLSIPYALEGRFIKGVSELSTVSHILTRSLALILMGVFIVNTERGVGEATGLSFSVYRIIMVVAFFLVWNAYPKTEHYGRRILFKSLQITGVITLGILALIFRDKEGNVFSPGWWGILGLIGWAYLFAAFVYFFARKNIPVQLFIFILLCILCLLQTPMKDGSILLDFPPGNFFNSFLDLIQIRNGAHPALVMAGMLFSIYQVKFLPEKSPGVKIGNMLIWAAVFAVMGYLTNFGWIISKLQASFPWVAYSIAISIAVFALLLFLTGRGLTSWFKVIRPAGTATLTCYMIPFLLYSLFRITGFRWPAWSLYGLAGILKCLFFALIVIWITGLLERLKIKLKV